MIFTHTVQTHRLHNNKPKPNCSSREGINSHRRHFGSIFRCYDRCCCRSCCRWRSIDRDRRIQQTLARDSVFAIASVCFFAYKKIARPDWDANSWEDVLSVDTNSLRRLPTQSSKNCDLQFANSDRFKENYSIDITHYNYYDMYHTLYDTLHNIQITHIIYHITWCSKYNIHAYIL